MYIRYVTPVFSDAKYFLGIVIRQSFEEILNNFQIDSLSISLV